MKTETGKTLPITCGWSARAENGLGALLGVAGVILQVRQTRETRQVTGLFTAAAGALVILVPTVLIGMCAIATHQCRTLTQPALEILGIIVLIIGLVLIFKKDPPRSRPDTAADMNGRVPSPADPFFCR